MAGPRALRRDGVELVLGKHATVAVGVRADPTGASRLRTTTCAGQRLWAVGDVYNAALMALCMQAADMPPPTRPMDAQTASLSR